jgi:type III secretory pathway lipoprotein EscJ
MNEMVHAAVAGDVREAEEIEEILRGAGIDAQLQAESDSDAYVILVREHDLERAQDAIEAGTDPDDLVAEP